MNFVKIEKELNIIQQLAITGFLFGNDNFGEDIIDVRDNLEYHEIKKGFSITVILRESPTHTSTSGIGFYLKGNTVMVYSSKEVITVGMTPEMDMLFNSAKNKGYGQ
tara:strand:+ start:456 stop:776 length:321 start_codon:yes stop_codon:yes gene_type:complete